MVIHYRWKELELLSVQTVSNIITFIQFSLIPLKNINNKSNKISISIQQFISNQFLSLVDFFNTPLELIHKYNKIIAPVRSALSPLLIFSIILYLYCIFFLPSYRLILFFADLFIPAAFVSGIAFNSYGYNEHRKSSIILIIIGVIYVLIRLFLILFPIIKRKNLKWYIKCSRFITSNFLSRIKNDLNDDRLNFNNQQIKDEIDQHEITIQFDTEHFTYKTRIYDFLITFFIWLTNLIIIIIGWERILKDVYKDKQLEDITFLSSLITYSIFIGICIRIIINIIFLIKIKEDIIFKIFKTMKKYSYKIMHFLANISILPVLKIAMNSTEVISDYCSHFQYFDSRLNADSFLQYFSTKTKTPCHYCSDYSASFIYPCTKICHYNPNEKGFYFYEFLVNSPDLTYSILHAAYLTQILFLFVYFLCIFTILYRHIYSINMNIITNLPSPTKNIECKFQTLIKELKSAPITAFNSYKYRNALYNFSFTGIKLFIVFWTTMLSFDNLPFINTQTSLSIPPFIFSTLSFVIAETQLFTTPYISILHNVINFFSYNISAIIIFFAALYSCHILRLSEKAGNAMVALIVITPIITALITPFFVKKDPLLAPTSFDLLKIQKWDKKLNQLLKFRHDKEKALKKRKNRNKNNENDIEEDFNDDEVLFEDEPSLSVSYFQKNDDEQRDHDAIVGNFDLLKLAPIQIQEQINNLRLSKKESDKEKYLKFKENSEVIWSKRDIFEADFDKAVNEMLDSADRLIDCVSYSNLYRLFNITVVFTSAILGWILSSGIDWWKKSTGPNSLNYYLRCNMLSNGSYPAFGTY